jgi:hypothetical protein
MTQCRATSFYVTPGQLLYFCDHTVATRTTSGEWVQFTHRHDLERYATEHPDWDTVCFVGPPGGIGVLTDALLDTPESVDRWAIDSRVVNGRAPAGPRHTLDQVATLTPTPGQSQALATQLFPNAPRPLRNAISAAAPTPAGPLALSVAVALADTLPSEHTAALVTHLAALPLAFAPADPALVAEGYRILADRYGPDRALAVLSSLGTFADLPASWRIELAETTTDPDLQRAFATDSDPSSHVGSVRSDPTPPIRLMACPTVLVS